MKAHHLISHQSQRNYSNCFDGVEGGIRTRTRQEKRQVRNTHTLISHEKTRQKVQRLTEKNTCETTSFCLLTVGFFLPDCSTREEDDAFQFFVVEEVVEGPETSVFTKRIRIQVRIVTVKGVTG